MKLRNICKKKQLSTCEQLDKKLKIGFASNDSLLLKRCMNRADQLTNIRALCVTENRNFLGCYNYFNLKNWWLKWYKCSRRNVLLRLVLLFRKKFSEKSTLGLQYSKNYQIKFLRYVTLISKFQNTFKEKGC